MATYSNMNNYDVLGRVGSGAFGAVLKVRRKADGKVLVWKEINYGEMTEKQKQQLVTEVNVLRSLNSPYIVKYFDRVLDKSNTKVYLVMEHCESGDLSRLIKHAKKTQELLSEDHIWRLFTQLVSALNECHMQKEGKILHRDIKPGNVFLDAHGNVKLGDFGLAKVINEGCEYATTHVGTPLYMSPEQLSEGRYNDKSDIWSAGCLLYELTTLNPPFEANSPVNLANKIKSGEFPPVPAVFSRELQRVISWMLTVDPKNRPNSQELTNIPQVALRIRERRIRETLGTIRKKEDEIRVLQGEIEQLEAEMSRKSSDLEEFLQEKENPEVSIEGSQTPDYSFIEAVENRRSVSPIARNGRRTFSVESSGGNKENEGGEGKKPRVQKVVPRLPLSRINRTGV